MDPDVNYEELARSTDDFNGAQCKAVCVEAGSDFLFLFLSHNSWFLCIFLVYLLFTIIANFTNNKDKFISPVLTVKSVDLLFVMKPHMLELN